MSRHQSTVAIRIKSAILSEGMAAIIHRMPGVRVVRDDSGETRCSLLVLDAGETAEAVAAASKWGCRVMGVAFSLVPKEGVTGFDDCVTVLDSEKEITARVAKLLEEDVDTKRPVADSQGDELSPREKDVVLGIVKGLSNKEIASEMCVSVNTVMTHRRNIAAKLSIHSPAGLTIYAIATGLVNIEEIKNTL